MQTSEICHDEGRRQAVREHSNPQGQYDFNGIDYVEVSEDQLTLTVYLIREVPQPLNLKVENVRIDGGRRITDIRARRVHPVRRRNPSMDDALEITLDKYGDFSTYTLRLVDLDNQDRPTDRPLSGFDPRYASVEFSFKASCPGDLDCLPSKPCPPAPLEEPEINYLAKDYASFRQLILDRLALLMPDWQERHVPDVGIALVEILAYVGDHLSYYQDAVATEACLDTARQRISVRRHARLVDYQMHEGCNARAWVVVRAGEDLTLPWNEIAFVTSRHDALAVSDTVLTPDDLRAVPVDRYEVFEPVVQEPVELYEAHNTIYFYTWGDRQCCLPRGATSATLLDDRVPDEPEPVSPDQGGAKESSPSQHAAPRDGRRLENLRAGQVLIFEEIKGPKTGAEADADPAHSHAVRLTKVEPGLDKLYNQPVVAIEWAPADALPFPLCISAISAAPRCEYLENVSLARGNAILVDHGRTVGSTRWNEAPELLGEVGVESMPLSCENAPCPPEVAGVPRRFRPRLQRAPLTFSEPVPRGASANNPLQQEPRRALPQIAVRSTAPRGEEHAWMPRLDLLNSGGDDRHFVVEIDNDGFAHLRFGDGELGRAPAAGSTLAATYRVGSGPAGNVGPESIAHLVWSHADSRIEQVRNPLAASGGVAPEALAEVKLRAPQAFRSELQRAITADDYARLAERDARVQRAAATLRWTGSWYEVVVAIDAGATGEASESLLHDIRRRLTRYRRIGHDLVVARARPVPLDIALTVCVRPGFLRGHVQAALLGLFSNRVLPDGRRGFFHPDNLSFGENIAASKIVSLAHAVPGVESLQIEKLRRLYASDNGELTEGILRLGPLEVARLDNDPAAPENGLLKLQMGGGR
ncbi:MAG TPA: putative baseplate assembly protein [Abditibacteriaceae bacterium]|nr:putative baseplate assembly protein [Abditibacteriaceae bacterium]